jgi:hypothetical protein
MSVQHHPSMLNHSQMYSQSKLVDLSIPIDLERENDRLVEELKKAKNDLALTQENSASQELHLKKEIQTLTC